MPESARQSEISRLKSITELAELCGMSRQTVRDRLKPLAPTKGPAGAVLYDSAIAFPFLFERLK